MGGVYAAHMSTAQQGDEHSAKPAGLFATTHWSVVLTARDANSPPAAQALDRLCQDYWYPIYAYVRRKGRTPDEAEDLTQAFFAHLLQKDFLCNVGREKGRFRSFLLACLTHFLVDEWEKARAARRGGRCASGPLATAQPPDCCPLDLERAEERYRLEPAANADPQSLYERRWALDLLDRVFDRLRSEAVASGKRVVFDQLQGSLIGERSAETYAQLGARLGMSETAVKVTVHRLRQQYRNLLLEEIAHTVATPDDIEEELRYLFEVVSRQ
jgi:RNA polymerase sigma factor (sigma-70 family)